MAESRPTRGYVRICKNARDSAESLLYEASEIQNSHHGDELERKALLRHAARAYTDAEDRYQKALEAFHA